MNWIQRMRLRLRALLDREGMDADLDDELRFHLEMETEANLRRGLDPIEARRQAVLLFGGVERFREECRDVRGVRPLVELWRDARFGMRMLRKSPGFTLVAILTLALGIGATTVVFSLANSVLLRPLVYPDAERIFVLWEQHRVQGLRPASYPGFRQWKEQSRSFSGLAFIRGEDFILRGPEGPQRLTAAFASGDFFQVLGTPPRLGRVFAEEAPGEERVVVLSDRLWRHRFGSDPGIVGRSISTPEGSFTVVGVMPPGFNAPFWADMWLPIEALPPSDRYALEQPNLHVDAQVMARLAPGSTREAAEAEMRAIALRMAVAYPEDSAEWTRVSLTSLPEEVLGDVDARLRLLGAVVLLVLLVTCVNIANLQLARASVRAREVAVRAALGAGRGRLIRQLLAESLVLALAGGLLGAALAAVGVRLLRRSSEDWWRDPLLPRLDELAVDGRVLAFALVLSLSTVLVFGLLPALRAAASDLLEPLKSGTPGAGADRGTIRTRAVLVVVQVALALMLVVGAGLLTKSLWRLQQVELGFEPDHLATVRIIPPSPRYDDAQAAAELYRRLREAMAAVPGVREAALANHLPLVGGAMPTRLEANGQPRPEGSDLVLFRTVSPEYFTTLRTRLLQGRVLSASDLAGPGGVVVNQAAVRRFWPDGSPIGRQVTVYKAAQGRSDLGEPITATVVGVIEDERFFDLRSEPPPAVYVPYTWNPWGNIFVTVRTDADPQALIPTLRRAVLEIDPDLPVDGPGFQTEFHTVDEYIAGQLEGQRLNTLLMGGFGAVAFLLAVLGIFGVMAYLVVRRTREIGLRIALGAQPQEVARHVTGQTLRLASIGIGLGLVGAFFATRVLHGLLFGVSVTDGGIFVATTLGFAVAALLASLLPARRAARIDPMVALRTD